MAVTNIAVPLGPVTTNERGTRGRHWIAPQRRRRLLVASSLMTGDLGVSVVAMHICSTLIGSPFPAALAAPPLLVLIYLHCGLYKGWGPAPFERFRLRTHGITLLIFVEFCLSTIWNIPIHLAASGSCALLLLILGHYVEAGIRDILLRRGSWGGPTAIVGCDAQSRDTAAKLLSHPELGLLPVGFIQMPTDGAADASELRLPVLGTIANLGRIASRVEAVVFTSIVDSAGIAAGLAQLPVGQFFIAGDSVTVSSLWAPTRTLGGVIGIEVRRDRYLQRKRLLKRLMDVVVAAPACVLSLPFIAALAVMIKIVDPGPAFYFQGRIGIGGRVIRICKLRTMYRDAEHRIQECLARDPRARSEWGRFFKISNDPRILPVIGNFIRRTSLDELPQFWNVLLGDMSLVGPRPFPAYHIGSFDEEFQLVRASVPPGLTGLWQISARSNGDLDVQRSEDLFYIVNWSLWLDLYILIETPLAVILRRGAR